MSGSLRCHLVAVVAVIHDAKLLRAAQAVCQWRFYSESQDLVCMPLSGTLLVTVTLSLLFIISGRQ